MQCKMCGRMIDPSGNQCSDCFANDSFVEYASDDGLNTEHIDICSRKPFPNSGDLSNNKNFFKVENSKFPIDKLTIILSIIVALIIFGAIYVVFHKNLSDISIQETFSDISTDENVLEPESTVSSNQAEFPAFLTDKVQLYPGQYVELTLYLKSSPLENWSWSSSDPDTVQVNSAGIATSSVAGAVAEIVVYDMNAPSHQASILVVCLSEEVQNEILMLEDINSQRYPFGIVDFDIVNFEPDRRIYSGMWDASVYDIFENIAANRDIADHISSHNLRRDRRFSLQINEYIDLYIYSDSQTEMIRKIAAYYLYNGNLSIKEYYFTHDGTLNYVHIQNHALLSISDEQYARVEHLYFDQDVMVRYRYRDAQDNMMSIVINENEQGAHFLREPSILHDESNMSIQALFDMNERDIINEAYTLLHELTQSDSVYQITGMVIDDEGLPLEGAELILVGNAHYGVELYKTITDENGIYTINILDTRGDYGLKINKDGYASVDVKTISFYDNIVDQYQEIIIMSPVRNTSEQVTFLISDAVESADEIVWQDRFEARTLRISFAQIKIREGINNTQGDPIAVVLADGHGIANIRLPVGGYTVEVQAEGYIPLYSSVYVYPNRNTERIFMSAELEDAGMRIVVRWQNTPEDLDLHIFTPHNRNQNAMDYHLGYAHVRDLAGNRHHIDSRNGFGPESVTVNAFENGVYRVYVTHYNACISNALGDEEIIMSQAQVYVYSKDGNTYVFNVPVDSFGNHWSVFEIFNQRVVPIQHFSFHLDSHQWCAISKDDD